MNELKNMKKRIRDKLTQFEIKHKVEFFFGIILVVIAIIALIVGFKNAMEESEIAEIKTIFATGIMFFALVFGATSIDESIGKK